MACQEARGAGPTTQVLSFSPTASCARKNFGTAHIVTTDDLCAHAEREGLVLLTTEKDSVRLHGDDEVAVLAARARALPVTLAFDDEDAFRSLLLSRLVAARANRRN